MAYKSSPNFLNAEKQLEIIHSALSNYYYFFEDNKCNFEDYLHLENVEEYIKSRKKLLIDPKILISKIVILKRYINRLVILDDSLICKLSALRFFFFHEIDFELTELLRGLYEKKKKLNESDSCSFSCLEINKKFLLFQDKIYSKQLIYKNIWGTGDTSILSEFFEVENLILGLSSKIHDLKYEISLAKSLFFGEKGFDNDPLNQPFFGSCVADLLNDNDYWRYRKKYNK